MYKVIFSSAGSSLVTSPGHIFMIQRKQAAVVKGSTRQKKKTKSPAEEVLTVFGKTVKTVNSDRYVRTSQKLCGGVGLAEIQFFSNDDARPHTYDDYGKVMTPLRRRHSKLSADMLKYY
ncbi:Uncharacterised protein at_DN2627 [Pycnogonum litorale]